MGVKSYDPFDPPANSGDARRLMAVGAQGPTDLMAFSGGSVQDPLSRREPDEHNLVMLAEGLEANADRGFRRVPVPDARSQGTTPGTQPRYTRQAAHSRQTSVPPELLASWLGGARGSSGSR